jgi:hypothetical protein
VTNAEQYHFADFTRQNYVGLLELAKRTYRFRHYWDFDRAERFVLWRHDIDFSPHGAVRLAEREAEAGVVATYFVSFHSEGYNLLERGVTDQVRRLRALGHDIALHFDLAYYPWAGEGSFVEHLRQEARALEAVVDTPCRAFSLHNPDGRAAGLRDLRYGGLINAAAEYFYTDVAFCSDSNGIWHVRRLEEALGSAVDARLQVLTHPEMWQDSVMSPRQRIQRCIDGRAEGTRDWYDRLLAEHGRENIDW